MNNTAMLVGLLLGLALGLAASLTEAPLLLDLAGWTAPFGDLFIRAIQMVVIPLVMAIVFSGVAGLGDLRELGRIGGVSLGFILGTTLPAILIGMGAMALALQMVPPVVIPTSTETVTTDLPTLIDFLVGLVPPNPVAAAAEGQLLPLLVFAVLAGAAAGTVAAPARERLVELADAVADTFIRLVHWILWTAPLGIFGLVASTTARTGLDLLQSLAVFVVTVIVALAIFTVGVYLPLVVLVGRVRPGVFARGTVGSWTLGFTTTSGVATLPVLLRDAPRLGVSERVYDLVIPLAVALNRAGSALFQGASVVFLVWLYGVEVPPGAWVGAVVAVFFGASTVAPVPSASIMTLAPALSAVGAPMAGLGLLLGIDRIPDMFRSATNMTGHMAAAVVTESLAGTRTAPGSEEIPAADTDLVETTGVGGST